MISNFDAMMGRADDVAFEKMPDRLRLGTSVIPAIRQGGQESDRIGSGGRIPIASDTVEIYTRDFVTLGLRTGRLVEVADGEEGDETPWTEFRIVGYSTQAGTVLLTLSAPEDGSGTF